MKGFRDSSSGEITRLLDDARCGQPEAAEHLLTMVYDRLRQMARRKMAGEPADHTLQATALVHEAYLRLFGSEQSSWRDRRHFYGAASEAMRRILVESARRRRSLKRGGGGQRVPLDEVVLEFDMDGDRLLDLDEVLNRMREEDRRMYDVVMLRFFAGLSLEQIAAALEISVSTVRREWRCAQVWIYDRLSVDDESDA
jgi:RNA polymerase sigma factor (TIGR02999 family)